MAVAEYAVQIQTEESNGLDLIYGSQAIFLKVQESFRKFYDLCKESGLFTVDNIVKIEQCALDFRNMCSETATVSKRVSDLWLDTAIVFFENIDNFDSPMDMMELLGKQARELAVCFKILAAWAQDLAGRFHGAQTKSIKDVESYQEAFKNAVTRADEFKNEAEKQCHLAKLNAAEAKASKQKWEYKQSISGSHPFYFLYTTIRAAFAEYRMGEMANKEEKNSTELSSAERALGVRKSQNEEAKVLAEKAEEIFKVLETMENTCNCIAAFWTMQAENFSTQGTKMALNQKLLVQAAKELVMRDNIEFWKEAKERMKNYATKMVKITNSFNFSATAIPLETRKCSLVHLQLTLNVPSSVNTQEIASD